MNRERLAQAETVYQAQQGELHRWLVQSVEEKFPVAILGELAPRIREAFMSVRRHRHVPLDYFSKHRDPDELMKMVYADSILALDPEETLQKIDDELAMREIDLATLTGDEIQTIIGFLESRYVSTLSSPVVVAASIQAVLPSILGGEGSAGRLRALDIGSGLGYQAALLNVLGFSEVIGVEIKPYLVERASRVAQEEGYDGVRYICGDGRLGQAQEAPYDAIVVGAAVGEREVVTTLLGQLRIGGKLVLPEVIGEYPSQELEVGGQRFVRAKDRQMLRIYERTGEHDALRTDIFAVQYVALRGAE